MDRDYFIIAVSCLVCDHSRAVVTHYPIRHGGIAPDLTDEEVITMEVCGEYFKQACDPAIFAYFRSHYRHCFPHVCDRTRFVRQAADLWHRQHRVIRKILAHTVIVFLNVQGGRPRLDLDGLVATC